jgi:hypothetical protein
MYLNFFREMPPDDIKALSIKCRYGWQAFSSDFQWPEIIRNSLLEQMAKGFPGFEKRLPSSVTF